MFVLDVDPPLGVASLEALTRDHGALPDTLLIRTPRGGLHYWFAGSCPSSVSRIGPKLDTRGDGGYVLVPPSAVNGVEYTYANETNDIAVAPAWIGNAIREARTQQSAAEGVQLDLGENIERARLLLRQYVADDHVAIENEGGDSRTYEVCAEVLDFGLTPQTAFDLLWAEWAPHCKRANGEAPDPAWFKGFLETKIVNAINHKQNEIGAWATPPSADVFAHVATLAPAAPDPKRSRFYPRDEDEQDARPAPTWLVPNLLPADAIALMYGPSGSYKSFLALDLALSLAAGIGGWGAQAQDPMPVVYIAAEGSRGVERLRRPAWREARGVDGPLHFYTVDTMPLIARPTEVIEMVEAIRARGIKPKLLVLDTLARAMAGKNENDAKDAGEFIEAIEMIKRTLGCTVLVLHHTGKDDMRGARGSSALAGGFDTTMEVKSDTDKKLTTVRITKQKDADQPEVPWTFKGEVVGKSLVFNEIDSASYNAIAYENDPFSSIKIGGALRELGAVSGETGITSQVLATHICPPLQSDTPESREKAVGSFAKHLAKFAKGRLAAYTDGEGRTLRWYVPTLDEGTTAPADSL